jgi:hypothetical protein
MKTPDPQTCYVIGMSPGNSYSNDRREIFAYFAKHYML